MNLEEYNIQYFNNLYEKLNTKKEDSYKNIIAIKSEKKEEDYLYYTYAAKRRSKYKVRY